MLAAAAFPLRIGNQEDVAQHLAGPKKASEARATIGPEVLDLKDQYSRQRIEPLLWQVDIKAEPFCVNLSDLCLRPARR